MDLLDAIRPSWLPGLNDITGVLDGGMHDWILQSDFAVHLPITKTAATLAVGSSEKLLRAFASDCNRMAIGALESVTQNAPTPLPGRSTAWRIIRVYYSAFFAAHAISRMLGHSLTYLDSAQLKRIAAVAAAYGQSVDKEFGGGLYHFRFHPRAHELKLSKVAGVKGGAHEAFWGAFVVVLQELETAILGVGTTADTSKAIGKLRDLVGNLTRKGHNGGSWLSKVRNDVNYSHGNGAWFPYKQQKEFGRLSASALKEWLKNPQHIDIASKSRTEMEIFYLSCSFLISLCVAMCRDMTSYCRVGRSFHEFGCNAFNKMYGSQAA